MPSIKARQLLSWAGSALSILAVIFIVAKLREYGSEIDYSLSASLFVSIIILSFIYCASNLLLVFSWRDLLRHFGVTIDTRLALKLYGESQLAKYVPGNIFHFVGRQVLGQERGLAAWPLGKSSLWEIGLLIASGCLFSILLIPRVYPEMPIILTLMVFIVAVFVASWVSNRWLSRLVAQVICRNTVFLIMSALIFLIILLLVIPVNFMQSQQIVIVCGAYVIAWLIGLITPGAPAGVGVREIVLYSLLHSIVKESDLLTAIVFGRIITVAGDFLFYLIAMFAKARSAKSA